MSLYYEAAGILDSARKSGGSFKSLVFGKKDWKSDRKALFALTTEASKWSDVLSEILERSDVLKVEKQLTPTLVLLLTYDLLLSKKGLALTHKHGLHVAISRHKARLAAEFTKARLRRGFATVDALRAHVNTQNSSADNGGNGSPSNRAAYPRWIRINTLRTSLDKQLKSTFAGYTQTGNLNDVTKGHSNGELVYIDEHIPNLLAVSPKIEIANLAAYREGKLILQDKASCFPAYLLDPSSVDGDIIDACAAPGNKTTHLAALIGTPDHGYLLEDAKPQLIFACERDNNRSQTLRKMVELAGASDLVRIKAKQDFLKLDPHAEEFASVSSLLLDPSCSGSGIIGRDEVVESIRLPDATKAMDSHTNGKKRKRRGSRVSGPSDAVVTAVGNVVEEVPAIQESDVSELQARLSALSTFQLRLLQHAMAFPAARRITYSTCSVHAEENEHVVARALLSDIAQERGWRIMRRQEQVEGLGKWHRRGKMDAVVQALNEHGSTGAHLDAEMVADACIRCEKGGEEGTMGFFVAGFVQDHHMAEVDREDGTYAKNGMTQDMPNGVEDAEEEWNGFSDGET